MHLLVEYPLGQEQANIAAKAIFVMMLSIEPSKFGRSEPPTIQDIRGHAATLIDARDTWLRMRVIGLPPYDQDKRCTNWYALIEDKATSAPHQRRLRISADPLLDHSALAFIAELLQKHETAS